MKDNVLKPDYLFEISWEVCNKTNGIHQVISQKAKHFVKQYNDHYICIGPDVWMETHGNPEFEEDRFLYRSWREQAEKDGIHLRIGRWKVPGNPVTILVDFTPLFGEKDKIFTELWLKYGLNSLSGQWDYTEPAMFGYAAGKLIDHFCDHHLAATDRLTAQFHDWNAGSGVLYLRDKLPQAGVVFTLHQPILEQTLAKLEKTTEGIENPTQAEARAQDMGIASKFSLEQTSVKHADCFTAVSPSVAQLTKKIYAREADALTVLPDEGDNADASWDSPLEAYMEMYDLSVHKVNERQELFKGKKQPVRLTEATEYDTMKPRWRKVTVEVNMPSDFEQLPQLARNLWWTWNPDAAAMFRSIDPGLWDKCEKNPNIMVDKLTMEHYERLSADSGFMDKYRDICNRFNAYMEAGNHKSDKQIAYFSMEYGLHESIKIYSGGLGVLAGDFLKQASDDNTNMVAVGLMYRYGYFSQGLSVNGEQLAIYNPHNFFNMSAQPVRDQDGKWVKIHIAFPGRTLHARIWRIDVGRIPLYLLDSDITENTPADRFITHQLYGGDWENRFKQEFLLGIGGIRLLDALGLNPDVFHCNEGHAAFTGLERLRKYVQESGLGFEEAIEVVRASSLFTTHTPVPAGHDFFSEDMIRAYMPHYPERLGISWQSFMGLGLMNPGKPGESYSMSVLATRLSRYVNGVSRIHGAVSRQMFKELYPGYFPEELHIGYVTNGVHYGTWTAPEWQELFKDAFPESFNKDISDPACWEQIFNVPDERIWDLRNQQRRKLLEYMKKRLLRNLSRRQETPRKIYQVLEAVNDRTLTIGFARRFATYKRARLLFNDLERLDRIVNNPEMPVQFVYAGKAHPADKAGQELIRHIVEVSKRKEFRGKIIFLEDYDMEVGAALTQGVDIWLNTPTRPLEASGTSGMKAVLNGVMNLSVLDGWWAEGYRREAGWYLKEERTYENQAFQDELDAETIYNLIESEIAPMFYERNNKNIPVEWVRWIKNNIAGIAPHFTNKRMLDEYFSKYYNPLFDSAALLSGDDFARAKEMVSWKKRISAGWEAIEVQSKSLMSNSGSPLRLGETFSAEIVLGIGDLDPADLGLEVVFVQKPLEGEPEVVSVYEMDAEVKGKRMITFGCKIPVKRTGVYNYAFRLFPKHPQLGHRQDFQLTKWL